MGGRKRSHRPNSFRSLNGGRTVLGIDREIYIMPLNCILKIYHFNHVFFLIFLKIYLRESEHGWQRCTEKASEKSPADSALSTVSDARLDPSTAPAPVRPEIMT